jgi:hypothetical protein
MNFNTHNLHQLGHSKGHIALAAAAAAEIYRTILQRVVIGNDQQDISLVKCEIALQACLHQVLHCVARHRS